jgi:hypothetical protein
MAIVVTLIVMALIAIALILYTRRKLNAPSPVSLHDLNAQINQAMMLSKAEPLLALQLAQRMTGNAQELALQLVAAELYLAGHQDQALEIRAGLPPHAQEYILNTLIESLLDSDDTQACLELLDRCGESLPTWPLLQVRILQARGEQDQAVALLGELGDPQHPSAQERQSIDNLLILARLQYQAGLQDAALASVEQAWSTFQASDESHRLSTLRRLFDAYADQGQFELILTRAAQLPVEEQEQAAAALFSAGQLDSAFSLLAKIGDAHSYLTYGELMDSALARHQVDAALRLLDVAPASEQNSLLLRLLKHHVEQGRTAEAEALLLARESEASQRPGMMLYLCDEHHAAQPQWTEALLAKALQQIDGLRDDHEFWSGLRLQALHTQLQGQSRLPAHRRDSWLVRTSLEEMHSLRQQQESEMQLLYLCEHAKLLHGLGQTAQGRTLLEQALDLLENAPDVDEDDKTLYLENIAESYLHLDEVEQAQTLHDRLNAQNAGSHSLEEGLLLHHIEHQRFAQAINALNLSTLFSEKKLLSRLHQALEELHKRSPERATELQAQLMERFTSGLAWRSRYASQA